MHSGPALSVGRSMFLAGTTLAWEPVGRLVRGPDAQVGHARAIALMRRADRSRTLATLARAVGRLAFPDRPVSVGGVLLPHPIIVAAGLVKGDGFASEEAAAAAAREERDIVPGWRTLPALVGAVEFGSYTRHPRRGNPGRVVWRDTATLSMQNRIGLRNPGAAAAAVFLGSRSADLPPTWGVSLAASPGVDHPRQAEREVREAAGCFASAFRAAAHPPAWVTLNLSCPNTEDDPQGRQTEELARRLAGALRESIDAPIWVKIGPDLSEGQLEGLLSAFLACEVRAVVATNTLARPAPGSEAGSGFTAGVSGAALRRLALDTVKRLHGLTAGMADAPGIVACGGILDGSDLRTFMAAGAQAAMVYSALVFRGPLAGAHILHEASRSAP